MLVICCIGGANAKESRRMQQLRISKSPRRRRAVDTAGPIPGTTAADTSAAEDLLERIDHILEVL